LLAVCSLDFLLASHPLSDDVCEKINGKAVPREEIHSFPLSLYLLIIINLGSLKTSTEVLRSKSQNQYLRIIIQCSQFDVRSRNGFIFSLYCQLLGAFSLPQKDVRLNCIFNDAIDLLNQVTEFCTYGSASADVSLFIILALR
jgi:hypothetical protein